MQKLLVTLLVLVPSTGLFADDRRADATVRVGLTRYDDLEATDTAFGLGLGYRFLSWLAADAQLSYAPKDLGASGFSGSRTEGFAGLRLGPNLDGTTVYVAARPGFVKFGGPDEPIACPAIFPPTLTCRLAEERVFATDLTGGVQLVRNGALLRFEVGDRLAKYPNPTFGPADELIDNGMWTHNLVGSVALGFRF
jgi:hypothetical protein